MTDVLTRFHKAANEPHVIAVDWPALAKELAEECEKLNTAVDRLLTCGNHVALYKTDLWPEYELRGLTRDQQCESALCILGATKDYDLWCCWSGMMQTRDTLNPHQHAAE